MTERNTKKLWFVLGGLIVLIVALVVGIVVVNLNTNREPKHTYPDRIHTKELSELNKQAAALPVEEAKALYEETISNAATELDRERTQVEYGIYLMKRGFTEESLNKLLTVNDEVLGAAYKMLLYSELRDYFYMINNQELANKYNSMISEAIRDSDYAAGG